MSHRPRRKAHRGGGEHLPPQALWAPAVLHTPSLPQPRRTRSNNTEGVFPKSFPLVASTRPTRTARVHHRSGAFPRRSTAGLCTPNSSKVRSGRNGGANLAVAEAPRTRRRRLHAHPASTQGSITADHEATPHGRARLRPDEQPSTSPPLTADLTAGEHRGPLVYRPGDAAVACGASRCTPRMARRGTRTSRRIFTCRKGALRHAHAATWLEADDKALRDRAPRDCRQHGQPHVRPSPTRWMCVYWALARTR